MSKLSKKRIVLYFVFSVNLSQSVCINFANIEFIVSSREEHTPKINVSAVYPIVSTFVSISQVLWLLLTFLVGYCLMGAAVWKQIYPGQSGSWEGE